MALSNTAKIVLVTAALIVTVILAIAIAGARWVLANKDRVNAKTRSAIDEGGRFGRTHPQPECPTEAMRRAAACTEGVLCPTFTSFFLTQCLQMNDRDDALCAGVPPRGPLTHPSAWPRERCIDLGRVDPSCVTTMEIVQSYCRP